MDRSIKTLKFAFSLKSVILSRPQMFKLQQKILKFKGICLARQKRSKKLGKIEVLRTSVFFSILFISFISFLLILETSIKGVLTPKTHRLFFHGIVLIILCKNSLVQSFKVCWSVLTSYEVTKVWVRREWRHTREYIKLSALVFLAHFCWFYGQRTFYTVLWSFWPFLINLLSCKVLND